MALQIFIGFCLIIVSIVIQVIFIEISIRTLKKIFTPKDQSHPGFAKFVITLSGISFWLLISISSIVWLWAFVFLSLEAFPNWEESIYFALVSFTTLGFGDILLPDKWRLLSGFIAANGFVIFGLNTAVLIETMIRLREDKF